MRSNGKQSGRVKRLTPVAGGAYPGSVVERKEEDVMKAHVRVSLRLGAPLT
jgi:hypothetical protein